MANEIIQKATEWDKQCAALKKKYRSVDELTDAGDYHWQPKYDGVHVIIDTTTRTAFSREGTAYPSVQHIVERLANACGTGLVFQGEVWLSGVPFKDISGAARRQYLQPHLGVVLYDVHQRVDFVAGTDPFNYFDRLGALRLLLAKLSGDPLIGGVRSYPATPDTRPIGGWQVLAQEYVSQGGYDGLILRDLNAGWQAGPVRNGELVKVKPSVSLDLRVTGFITEVGEKTGRPVYKLLVDFRGEDRVIGSGVPHNLADLPELHDIIEVECMCINPNNTLREPRFKAVRHDKSEPDA